MITKKENLWRAIRHQNPAWVPNDALFMPPDVWRKTIMPGTQRIYNCLKERDIVINQHSCGKIEDIFADMVEMGANVWNPCQPCNDLASLKKRFAGRIAFCGGIDSQFVLDRPGVTAADVRAEVRRRIDELGAGGGYIAAPSHSVPYNQDLVDAMKDEIESYGRHVYRRTTEPSDNSKRILLIAPQPFFQWRGSPIRVGFDALALSQLGYTVDLLVLPVGDDRAMPGVNLLRVANPLCVRNVSIGPSPMKAFFDVLLLLKGIGLVRRHAYEAVHGIEDAGAIAIVLARLGHCRAVFEKHSDPSSHRKGAIRNAVLRLYSRFEAWTIRHADAVIATGPGLAEQARGVPGAPVCHWIPDIPSSLVTADPARVREARARLAAAPGDILVMYVGSFAVYQGVDLMFDAIVRAAPRDPRLRFTIVGGSPAEIEARVRALTAEGLADRVLFPGKIPPDELPHVLAAADILLSPRLSGVNTPLKLLDYMKAGGAIVATRTTANTLILDDETAELTAPDATAFADGIMRLADDQERRGHLSRAAREHIGRLYNFDEFKTRLRRCYDTLPRAQRPIKADASC